MPLLPLTSLLAAGKAVSNLTKIKSVLPQGGPLQGPGVLPNLQGAQGVNFVPPVPGPQSSGFSSSGFGNLVTPDGFDPQNPDMDPFSGSAPLGAVSQPPSLGQLGLTSTASGDPTPTQQTLGLGGVPPLERGKAAVNPPSAERGFNPLNNFFTGTLNNPNALLRLSEGYNRGGLVGALGLLGTDFSKERNQQNPKRR